MTVTITDDKLQPLHQGKPQGGKKKERNEHNQHMGKSVQTFVSKSVQTFVSKSVQTFVELLRKDRPIWTLTKSGLKRDGPFSEGPIYVGIWRVWFQTSFEWRVHLHGDMKSMVSKMFWWRVHLHWDMKSMVSKRFWWRVHLHWDIKSTVLKTFWWRVHLHGDMKEYWGVHLHGGMKSRVSKSNCFSFAFIYWPVLIQA